MVDLISKNFLIFLSMAAKLKLNNVKRLIAIPRRLSNKGKSPGRKMIL